MIFQLLGKGGGEQTSKVQVGPGEQSSKVQVWSILAWGMRDKNSPKKFWLHFSELKFWKKNAEQSSKVQVGPGGAGPKQLKIILALSMTDHRNFLPNHRIEGQLRTSMKTAFLDQNTYFKLKSALWSEGRGT